MRNENERHSHIHVYMEPATPRKKPSGVGIVLAVVALLWFFVWLGTEEQNADPTLYETSPADTVIGSLADYGAGASLHELVLPKYDFLLDTGETTAQVSLPLIQGKFAEDFNREIIEWVNSLHDDARDSLHQVNSLQLKSIDYEAFLERDILTVLICTEYVTGESRWSHWIFDLKQDGKRMDPRDLTQSLLGMDYATFLWVTDRCVQNRFVDENWWMFRGIPEDEMSEDQYSLYEAYMGILSRIPTDLRNAASRWIFPANGTVYLLYELPVFCDDWQSYLETETRRMEMDDTVLSLAEMVTPKEAVADVVFESTVHVMGGSDQAHAKLVRLAFYSAPRAFLGVVGDLEGQEYAVERLLWYAGDEELQKISDICTELRYGDTLTKEENAAAYLILTSIKAVSGSEPEG